MTFEKILQRFELTAKKLGFDIAIKSEVTDIAVIVIVNVISNPMRTNHIETVNIVLNDKSYKEFVNELLCAFELEEEINKRISGFILYE